MVYWLKQKINSTYQVSLSKISITFVELKLIHFCNQKFCILIDCLRQAYTSYKLKVSIFSPYSIVHYIITSLLFQAFLWSNSKVFFYRLKGAFQLLYKDFLWMRRQLVILYNFPHFTKLQLLELFLGLEHLCLQFWTCFCNFLNSCFIQGQGNFIIISDLNKF